MAVLYLSRIRSIQPSGPYHFFGVSSGGLIALEMARQLIANNQKAGLLVLGDTKLSNQPGDQGHDDGIITNPLDYWKWVTFLEIYFFKKLLTLILPGDHLFWNMGQSERFEFLWTKSNELGDSKLPKGISIETFKSFYYAFETYFSVYKQYIPPKPYAGHVKYINVGKFNDIELEMIREISPNDCENITLPEGHHLDVANPPGARQVARYLLEWTDTY